jgi:hypothetical protein
VKVVLLQKLADWMDGVDVSTCAVGDLLDVPEKNAAALIAEQWAVPDRRQKTRSPERERRATPLQRCVVPRIAQVWRGQAV